MIRWRRFRRCSARRSSYGWRRQLRPSLGLTTPAPSPAPTVSPKSTERARHPARAFGPEGSAREPRRGRPCAVPSGPGAAQREDRLTIDRIVSRRFSSAALYARIRLEFEPNLESGKLAKALEWYDSPLGKRITGLELASLMLEIPDFEKDRPSKRRLDLIRRLDAGGGASDTTVDVTMAIVRNLTRAFQPALPAVARLSPGQLEHELTQVRNLTLERIRRACLLNMLTAYRDLTDQELEQYVRFVESESGSGT